MKSLKRCSPPVRINRSSSGTTAASCVAGGKQARELRRRCFLDRPAIARHAEWRRAPNNQSPGAGATAGPSAVAASAASIAATSEGSSRSRRPITLVLIPAFSPTCNRGAQELFENVHQFPDFSRRTLPVVREKACSVRVPIPRPGAARTARRTALTPSRCPALRGRPRARPTPASVHDDGRMNSPAVSPFAWRHSCAATGRQGRGQAKPGTRADCAIKLTCLPKDFII